MVYFKLFFIFMFMFEFLFSAATFNQNVTAAQLATTIQGRGITITNPVITRGQIGGANSQVATFTNGIGGANLQIDAGILLTASTAVEAFSTNNSGQISRNPGNINNVAGLPLYDADLLTTINQNAIFNQVIFEFDVTLDANTRLLLVDYQFASDEYPEWVGSIFNDAFGFFIYGGDLANTLNIARVVDDSIIITTANIANFPPVNINNVNNGSVGSQNSGQAVDLNNSAFFIDNGGTNTGLGGIEPNNIVIESEFDGFTKRLHATLDNLTPGFTYHFKMALADTSDTAWDAGVFVNKIIGVRVPDVCYDYDVHMGNIFIPSENNDIDVQPYPGEQLTLGIAIQSLEGELPLLETNLTVILQPTNGLELDTAYLSPDSINAYMQIPPAYVKKVPYAQVPIGENINNIGGTINNNQVIFTKFNYDFNGTSPIQTHFELTSNITLDLNGILVQRQISTANGTLPRCPTQAGYHPDAASINIERRDSDQGPESHRHLLYTQIAGKPFDVDVVSYDPDDLDDQEELNNMSFEVELIDAGKYLSSSKSLFTCREPDSISSGHFVKFPDGHDLERVPLNAISTDTALRNAAFRLWYFEDLNNTAVEYTCVNYDNTCFQNLYNSKFEDIIDKAPYKCQTACSTGNCYECLKTYFAKPICSRDNFSVRPEAYSISILDNNESSSSLDPSILIGKNNTSTPTLKLAAEYKYKLEGNATLYGTNSNALGYYTTATSNLVSQFNFNMPLNICADNSNKEIGAIFHDGRIQYTVDGSDINFTNNNLYNHNNVGRYNYHIEDSNWTIVDQASYSVKTFPGIDECDISSASSTLDVNNQHGCNISTSPLSSSLTYVDLPLEFKPYKFDISPVKVIKYPDDNQSYAFLSDLSDPYYDDVLIHPYTEMSTTFEGNISAQGRNGTILTNFTNGCAAEDVILQADVNTSTATTAPLIQYLQHTDQHTTPIDSAIGFDKNLTFTKVAFTDAQEGIAKLLLNTNFQKDKTTPVNPFIAFYNELNASSPDAYSNANMKTDYIPDGNNTYDRNITYYYAKITPQLKLYDNVKESFKNTTLFVDIYCSYGDITCDNDYNLTNLSSGIDENSGNWYGATMFDPANDGKTNLEANTLLGEDANPSVKTAYSIPIPTIDSNTDIPFEDTNASKEDINVSVSGPGRPSTVGITIKPVPWLLYNSYGLTHGWEEYRVKFIGNNSWSGVGDRGAVVETTSNKDPSPRMNW